MTVKVSIITPSYNSSRFLPETLNSIKNQTYSNWEWLIIDDCSHDDSYEVAKSYATQDERIKVLRLRTNSGASFSRNVGLEMAIGEYVAFLDADDLWEPNKLEVQVKEMEDHHLDFSFHSYSMINVHGDHIKYIKVPFSVSKKNLEIFNPIFTSSVMLRKDAIKGKTFNTDWKTRQDYIFWYEILSDVQEARGIEQVLGAYRTENSDSLSSKRINNAKIQWKIYRTIFKMKFTESIYSLFRYTLNGVLKYFF